MRKKLLSILGIFSLAVLVSAATSSTLLSSPEDKNGNTDPQSNAPLRRVAKLDEKAQPDDVPAASPLRNKTTEETPFVGQDLHVAGPELISYQLSTGEHILVFRNGVSMSIGANQFSSDSAVVWLESITTEFRGQTRIDYKATAYLQGNVSVKKAKGAKTTDLKQTPVPASQQEDAGEETQAVIVQFEVSGEVFVTADKREISDPRGLELYVKAIIACRAIGLDSRFVVEADIPEPEPPQEQPTETPPLPQVMKQPTGAEAVAEPAVPEPQPVAPPPSPEEKEPRFIYPVNIAPAEEVAPKVELDEEKGIRTVTGRFYIWQKQDEKGGLLELQADNAVIFSSSAKESTTDKTEDTADRTEEESSASPAINEDEGGTIFGARDTQEDILSGEAAIAIYLSGDVLMTKGQRTIRADEIYYDFETKKALAVNAVMRNFDAQRGIPIYVRATKLRQLAENKFSANDITLTSSEFYVPQTSLNASEIIITDTTDIDERQGKVSDRSYDAQMRNVRFKRYNRTLFYWPFIRANAQRPDVPLKTLRVGYGTEWGASVESRWYLARLLGIREPEGTESTLALDYYGKRGVGGGIEIEYKRENYFGNILGYVIHDSGEDRLSRNDSRKDLKPPRELRGRFRFQHRHFLPYNWQLTTEFSYLSDENFLEEFYRKEFNTEKEQETLVHLKRIEDNWGLSFLGKARINDFADQLEEMPTAEFHWTGQSFSKDRFTLYSDTQVSRLRQRIGNEHSIMMDEGVFSFVSHRTEVDMPVRRNSFKIVPFIAGTFAYDDRSGFRRSLVDGTYTGQSGEDKVMIGEAGVRISQQPYWKVYPNVKSRLWDLNQLRHIVRPYLTAVGYLESDSVVDQRDTVNIGLSQQLQTKRGVGDKTRTVDWMRLDTEITFVDSSESAGSSGPDRFIWNKPMVPMRVLSAPAIFNGDLAASLQRFEMFGPRRDYVSADYIWRISDTTALLSDMNLDLQSGVVQQFNIGFSRLCWPNLSYYIGSRYLRRVRILNEEGSNIFTFAASYILDPRYTLVFSQQFDFDYGANIRSEISLVRRYHRTYWALTYSTDESLDSQAIVLNIWPQGVPEMSFGTRKYMGLSSADAY